MDVVGLHDLAGDVSSDLVVDADLGGTGFSKPPPLRTEDAVGHLVVRFGLVQPFGERLDRLRVFRSADAALRRLWLRVP
ncbi:hypothetical protein ACIOD2_44095 [Amycolatopsis sp. NPDC088138]|uniref:hypothetical protein n=1 Tax=Amycolatopsis sp. NPDC088138 TaxID=3363938 RepID=UPI00380B31D7